jgi:hypothetical protein
MQTDEVIVSPSSSAFVALVEGPAWLGEGPKALIMDGCAQEDTWDGENGSKETAVFSPLIIGPAVDATEFNLTGDLHKGCHIQIADGHMWLENKEGHLEAETPVKLYGCEEHPEWAKQWLLNEDRTLSPDSNPHGVCLGVQEGVDCHAPCVILLVPRDDVGRRLTFASDVAIAAHLHARQQKAVAQTEAALAQLTPEFCAQLKEKGYARVEGAIPPEVIGAARAKIHCHLGDLDEALRSGGGMHSDDPVITRLLTGSAMPHVLSKLVGGTPDWYREHYGDAAGQVALIFPGDKCSQDCVPGKLPREKLAECIRGWHIDGCGVGDGVTCENFDVLVGVLLGDLPNPIAGELLVHPRSHTALAARFASGNGERLESLRINGEGELPTGDETAKVFGSQPVHHCLGKAGDVFLVHHLVAHSVCPNASGEIRYACYFRVKGPRFIERMDEHGSDLRAMVEPWANWEVSRVA